VSRFQPLRPKSYLFKNCITGLAIATLVSTPHQVARSSEIKNQAQYEYGTDQEGSTPSTRSVQDNTGLIINNNGGLIDPLGIITGCDGKPLDSYTGYTVALYNVATDRLNPTSLVILDETEIPDIAGNGVPLGLTPNDRNVNPFPLTNSNDNNKGRYNFLFNRTKGQINVGKSYILVVKPPTGSAYGERRVRIDITGFSNNILSYQATSLDGKPLSTTDSITKSFSVNINDAGTVGLSLVSLQSLGASVCDDQPVQIVKSADRATAEPGDTVVYRLTLRNQSNADIINPIVRDTLPLGMSLRTNSVRAQLADKPIQVTTTQQGNIATFQIGAGATGFVIPARQVINLAYAVTLDADAIRGTGRNVANLTGIRSDNSGAVNDTATHSLSIRQGLIRDTGTLIGRVFVDKNFDGQQQGNEPGIPNAVIFMDDGNRVTTDSNGLFSIQSAVAGYRTGALDLGSLPGYSLAPNLYFSERNSRSRLVKLAPGGIVRMNFGVTPTAREVK
jgi:uncharacterized repeat protein (TIGR01451 family)